MTSHDFGYGKTGSVVAFGGVEYCYKVGELMMMMEEEGNKKRTLKILKMQRGRFIELIVAPKSKRATLVEGVIVICTSTTYCPLGDNIKANKQRSLVCWPLQHQLGRRTTKTGATIIARLPPFSKTKPNSSKSTALS